MPSPAPAPTEQAHRFDALRVVTSAAWVARDFASAGVIPVILDYGFDPPPAGDALWCAGAYANRCLITDGVTLPELTAPDHHFLDRLPYRHTRRRISTRTVAEWRATGDPGHGFMKFPLMKQALFPAAEFTGSMDALHHVAKHYNATPQHLVEGVHLQHSGIIDFAREFRCFIADGEVTAASFYLEQSRDDTGTVVSETTWQDMGEDTARDTAADAAVFATEVISQIEAAPAGYTLDVGQLTDGRWAVVEANAAWSSNPYHSDPAGAIASILASQRPGGSEPEFAWNPEQAFLSRVNPLGLSL